MMKFILYPIPLNETAKAMPTLIDNAQINNNTHLIFASLHATAQMCQMTAFQNLARLKDAK